MLRDTAYPHSYKEVVVLDDYALHHGFDGGGGGLLPYDTGYWSKEYIQSEYGITGEMIK